MANVVDATNLTAEAGDKRSLEEVSTDHASASADTSLKRPRTEPEADGQIVDASINTKDDPSAKDAVNEATPEVKMLPNNRAQEAGCGIRCFLSPATHPIVAIVKHRIEDFHVREVDTDGNILHLDNFDIPGAKIPVEAPVSSPAPTESPETALIAEIGQELFDALTTLRSANPRDHPAPVTLPKQEEKARRTQQHALVKAWSEGDIATTTLNGAVIAERTTASRSQDSRRNSGKDGMDRKPAYVHATLYKFDRDTMNAVGLLANLLKIPHRNITFAGTKDRRACTTQRVSFQRVSPQALIDLNPTLKSLCLGNLTISQKPLRLGDLAGNHFTLLLRHVGEHADSDYSLDDALASLRDKGFINYFGMQRFGTGSVPSHHIGQAILQKDFKTAIDLVMLPRVGDSDADNETRRQWYLTQDHRAAHDAFNPRSNAERSILRALLDGVPATDHSGIFRRIPRNLRNMYLHAYQSYVWNHAVSARLSPPFPADAPIVGDIVPASTNADPTRIKDVKVLTEADLPNYSIYDVLLPLPGWDVIYPENALRTTYEATLAADGLDPYKMRRSVREDSLPGAYRHLLTRPSNVSWKSIRYDDDLASLLRTDLDILNGVPEPMGLPNGKYRALHLELTLGTSQYATMALREILRGDSSSEYQQSLSASVHPAASAEDASTD